MSRELVVGEQAPEAALRPLKQPLFDTELVPSTVGIAQLVFFQRPVGQAFAAPAGARAKTFWDTNMNLPGQLGQPQIFDLYGFNMRIIDDGSAGITAADYRTCMDLGHFTFNFGQGRPWLRVQAKDIPAGCDEYRSSIDGAAALDAAQMANGVVSSKEMYNFLYQKQPVKIHSQEAFNCQLDWPVRVPVPAADDMRITILLRGILYAAL